MCCCRVVRPLCSVGTAYTAKWTNRRSVAHLLFNTGDDDTLNEGAAATAIRAGVEKVLNDGYRSGDLWREGNTLASTSELGDLVKDAAVAAL